MADEQDLNAQAQASPVDGGQPDAKPVDKSEAEPKKDAPKSVNWQDDPKYRQQQAERDRELARLKRERDEALQRQEQDRQRRRALEDQTYGKDDYGKMQLAAQRAIEERDYYKSEFEKSQAEEKAREAKKEALSKLAEKANVPVDELMEAGDWYDAFDLALTAREKRAAAKAAAKDQEKRDNAPDLGGGGRGSAAATGLQGELNAARKRKDAGAIWDIRMRAQKEGVKLT